MNVYRVFICFKQKTAYEMRISDWSSDVCSSDLADMPVAGAGRIERRLDPRRREGRARRALGEGRTADVAEAEEEDRGFPFSIVMHVVPVKPKLNRLSTCAHAALC